MDFLLIVAAIVLGLPAVYWLVARPTKLRKEPGRPDELERPELTGTEQYKRRKLD